MTYDIPTLYYRELTTQYIRWGGEFGGERVHVYVWLESFCCPPETISQHVINWLYSDIIKKKSQ